MPGCALDFHSTDPAGLASFLRWAGYKVLWNVRGHYGHLHVQPDGPQLALYRRPLIPGMFGTNALSGKH